MSFPDGSRLWVEVLLLLVGLLLSAFFSGSEAAFLALQKVRLRHLVEKGVPGAERISRWVERPERFLSTVLLGNNLANTLVASLATAMALSLLRGNERLAVTVATVGATALLLVFGEVVPKSLATRRAERVTFLALGPLRLLSLLLYPFALALQGIGAGVARLMGAGSPDSSITEEELRTLIAMGEESGAVERHEAEILEKALKFGDRRVSEVMTPRTEVVWVERGTPLRRFLQVYREHPHGRYPVFSETVDNVVGILSIRDLLSALAEGALGPDDDVTSLARPPFFIPDSKKVGELWVELRQTGHPMAVVVDEFGGVAGIVTRHDLVEEIVGTMAEEWQTLEEEYRALGEDVYEVDGGMRVEELNEKLGLQIPRGDYETLAGFVLHTLGRIPQEGDQFIARGLQFTVTEMQGVKIERVRIRRMHPSEPGEEPASHSSPEAQGQEGVAG